MTDTVDFLVYQAYGNTDILNEALISIASLYKVTSSGFRPQIYIYTDNPLYFKLYLPDDIHYIEIKNETWEKWKGDKAFVHRAKIKMLLDFSSRYNGNILYCDTDTYFQHNPEILYTSIKNGSYVMHVDEGMLNDSINKVFQKLNKFLKSYQNTHLKIPATMHMWNAGVLGFKSEDAGTLTKVLHLADDLYFQYEKHVMEQLAFSYYFGLKMRVPCDEIIFHYWDFKEYRETLKSFFNQNSNVDFELWISKTNSILPMELIKSKQLFLKKPYWKRKFLKLIGKK